MTTATTTTTTTKSFRFLSKVGCMGRQLLLVLLLLCDKTLTPADAAGSSFVSSSQRPSLLNHVDREALQAALAVAKERHARAVQQALSNYPTDQILIQETENSNNHRRLDPSLIELQEYRIEAPGSLPDFSNELPRKVCVTRSSTPLLTPEECQHVIQLAEEHFKQTNDGQWSMQKSGQYEVAGFWIKDIPAVHEWFVQTVKSKLFPLLAHTFPDFVESDVELCVDNAYLFKYTPETGRRTDVHTDSGCLSFTIALNSNQEYQGGGTWFEGLTKSSKSQDDETDQQIRIVNNGGIVEMDVGQVTIRPGGVKHCGYAVQSGVRYIIGGFCMHRRRPEPVRMLLGGGGGSDNHAMKQVDILEAAVALNPACDAAYTLLANEYEQHQKQVEKAKQLLEYCLQNVHPKSGEVAYSLGSIYLQQQQFEKAFMCFDICLQADDCDIDAMRGMAETCAGLGDRTAEEAYYRRIVDTHGASPKLIASAYCNLGVLYEGINVEQEIDCYQKALQYKPDAFAARYSLACALASQDQWKEAAVEFRTAVELATSSSFSNDDDNIKNNNNKVLKEQADMALQRLYISATKVVQAEVALSMSSSTSTSAESNGQSYSREAMVQKIQEIMGEDNYNRLAALAASQRQ